MRMGAIRLETLPCPRLPLGFVVVCPHGDEKANQKAQHEVQGYIGRFATASSRVEYRPEIASQPGRGSTYTSGNLARC